MILNFNLVKLYTNISKFRILLHSPLAPSGTLWRGNAAYNFPPNSKGFKSLSIIVSKTVTNTQTESLLYKYRRYINFSLCIAHVMGLVLVEESYRNTLNKLILLFFLVNFVEWVMFMFLTKPDLKILLFHFKNST